MNTPEKSTKLENINEYRFVDAISLTLAKWNAWKCSIFAFDTLL